MIVLAAALAGFIVGFWLCGVIMDQAEPPTHTIIVLRPDTDARPGRAVIDCFTASRMLKHSIINRSSRN